jgi:uncharacterized surface protein with fasciclin (FAS1) repeats
MSFSKLTKLAVAAFVAVSSLTASFLLNANAGDYDHHAMKMSQPQKSACPFSMASANIVGTAQKAGMFSTLIVALKATGLDKTLASKDSKFTVFAPTDDAFKKLPAGTVESLLKPENKAKLTKILTYHVVAKPLNAGSVLKMPTIGTVEGSNLTVSLKQGKPFVNNSQITKTNIYATNGIIHVVDTVLMPKD